MRQRVALVGAFVLIASLASPAFAVQDQDRRGVSRDERALPRGWKPAVLSQDRSGRYFVQLRAPAVLERGGGWCRPG